MSITQGATYLGVERKTLYDAIKAGRLPAGQLIGRTAIRRSDLDAYRESTLRPYMRQSEVECSVQESGWLGVGWKKQFRGREDFPRPDTPTMFTNRTHWPEPGTPSHFGDVCVTRQALRDRLERWASDPGRQEEERVAMLSELNFNAEQPYEVLEDWGRDVYYFRPVQRQDAQDAGE